MTANAPLLRCLIPFALGILAAEYAALPVWAVAAIMAAVAATLFCLERFLRKSPVRAIRLSWLPTTAVMMLCALAGLLAATLSRPATIDIKSIAGKISTCRITKISDSQSATRLSAILYSESPSAPAINVLLLLDHKNYTLTEGDIIAINACLAEIRNLGNPEEFDYSTFMRHRGCRYSASLGEGDYRVVGHSDDFFSLSLHSRRWLVNKVVNSALSVDARQLLCTAILGDASMISYPTRATFSKAGIAHTLAISGLHTGIILTLITLLLRPLDFIRLRWLRWIVTIMAMCAFLFVTGMSVSAIRATIMACIIIAATLWQRDGSGLNSLCFAAIVILAFSPMAIYEVGFQLSFAAVAAILLLSDKLNFVSRRNRIKFAAVSWVLATLIANLGCAVISAHYFHTLPLLSVFSNLIVIPILPVYVASGVLYLIGLSLGFHIAELSFAVEWFTKLINGTASAASGLPLAYIDNLYVSLPTIVLYYAAFAFALAWVYRRSLRYAVGFGVACTVLILCIGIEQAIRPRSGFFILSSRNATPILYYANGEGYLWCPDRDMTPDEFKANFGNLLAKYGIANINSFNPCSSNADTTMQADSLSHRRDEILNQSAAVMCGKRIVVASATDMRYFRSDAMPLQCDYLIVSSRYYGNLCDLLNVFAPKVIVLSCSLFDDIHQRFIAELPSLPAAVTVHDIATDGAISVLH